MSPKCFAKTRYYVTTRFFRERSDCWLNYIATPSLARARMANAKLPVKKRQIDVRTKGKDTYVLKGSWS